MNMRSIVRTALQRDPTLSNQNLRNIVATALNRSILYNLSGTMVKQERGRLKTIYLFVYGTLMRGFGNNQRFLSDGEFVDQFTIKGFDMYTNGYFPMLVKSDDPEKIVHGELFKINAETFKQCDYLEGYPRHYNRMQVSVNNVQAWVYYYVNFEELRPGAINIESGNFREWHDAKLNAARLAVNNVTRNSVELVTSL